MSHGQQPYGRHRYHGGEKRLPVQAARRRGKEISYRQGRRVPKQKTMKCLLDAIVEFDFGVRSTRHWKYCQSIELQEMFRCLEG
jgi:hypothetical protein